MMKAFHSLTPKSILSVYHTEFVLEDDVSVMTYRGHVVNKSLIRAKFSPLESTGQRYIYTGDGSGRLICELQFFLLSTVFDFSDFHSFNLIKK